MYLPNYEKQNVDPCVFVLQPNQALIKSLMFLSQLLRERVYKTLGTFNKKSNSQQRSYFVAVEKSLAKMTVTSYIAILLCPYFFFLFLIIIYTSSTKILKGEAYT